jgi:hypothetical protein
VAVADLDDSVTVQHFRLSLWNWMIPSVSANAQQMRAPDNPAETADREEAERIIRIAKEMCLKLATVTTEILVAADASFGPIFNTLVTPQSGIVVVSFLLSGNLDSAQEEEMLLQIMRILVRCSRNRNLVKGVTHMLLKMAADQGMANSKDSESTPAGGVSQDLLNRLTFLVKDLAWEQCDHLSFSSQYPNHVNAKDDPNEELSGLLESWAELSLQEAKGAATEEVGEDDQASDGD